MDSKEMRSFTKEESEQIEKHCKKAFKRYPIDRKLDPTKVAKIISEFGVEAGECVCSDKIAKTICEAYDKGEL